jgi:hypothetical protein
MYLPGRLQNSHRNGGRVCLIFVADPRTAELFRNFSRDDDHDTRKGPVRCVPRHADANLMYGSVHADGQHDG